jgi:hypothetical protein
MGAGLIVAEQCSCPCGIARFRVNGRALTRFICHCRICQSLYQAPIADVTSFRASAITITTPDNVRFGRYRAPPALRRVAAVRDALPKVSGYWRSELAVSRAVLAGLVHGGA